MSNSLPAAIAWLETSAKSWTHSDQQVYARALLDEMKRLSDSAVILNTELEKREELRKQERTDHVALVEAHQRLKEELERERDAAAADRTGMQTRLTNTEGKLAIAENLLRDVHHALLKQPELTREDIAAVITSVVTPYPEGAKA